MHAVLSVWVEISTKDTLTINMHYAFQTVVVKRHRASPFLKQQGFYDNVLSQRKPWSGHPWAGAKLPDGTVGTSPASHRSHLNNSEKAQNCKHILLTVKVGINEVLSKCAQNESLKLRFCTKIFGNNQRFPFLNYFRI